MKEKTINKRIMGAIEKLHPCETDYVKGYLLHMTKLTFKGLEEHEIDERTGKPYTSSQNCNLQFPLHLMIPIHHPSLKKQKNNIKGI